jgi:hypothetical protein
MLSPAPFLIIKFKTKRRKYIIIVAYDLHFFNKNFNPSVLLLFIGHFYIRINHL